MKCSVYIETPYGVFRLVKTDLSKGSSCSQCALSSFDDCLVADCVVFDNIRHSFHFVRGYEK